MRTRLSNRTWPRNLASTQGLTIVEALVTMFILSLVLLITTSFLTELGRISRHAEQGDSNQQLLRAGVEQVQRDVKEAVRILVPSPESSDLSHELIVNKLDKSHLQDVWDPSPGPLWSFRDPRWILRVRLSRQGDEFWREVTDSNNANSSQVLGTNLNSFWCRFEEDGLLEFGLTAGEGHQTRRLSSKVALVVGQ